MSRLRFIRGFASDELISLVEDWGADVLFFWCTLVLEELAVYPRHDLDTALHSRECQVTSLAFSSGDPAVRSLHRVTHLH